MAVRNFLAKHRLDNFKYWLVKNGWVIEDHSKNEYAVLRARNENRKCKHPLIVYEKDKSTVHYTVQGRDFPIVLRWLRETRNKS